MDFRGRKVTIMGLGRHGGGVAAARYCALGRAMVTVTDTADETALVESVAALRHVPIAKFALGEHRDVDFSSAEIVVVNPAVKPNHWLVKLAQQSGAMLTSETELFLNACRATVIGVTGTVGKSTTAAMLAAVLQAAGRRTWLGGNIGQSLLADLPQIRSDDFVVLELSSFQLHWLSETARWPQAAIVTNCSPNHLDWHGKWEEYVAAKQRLVSHLPPNGFAVLNSYDAEVGHWDSLTRSALPTPQKLETVPPLRLPGNHNRQNAACAATMAKQLGIDEKTIANALGNFTGLLHRLRLVAEIKGRHIYNDSKSTTPTATIAAIFAMDEPTWLLLGGADKDIDWSKFIDFVVQRAKGVATFGAAADRLDEAITRATKKADKDGDNLFPSFRCETMPDALLWCWQKSMPGEAILLSPGCPSTDRFRDFADRGEQFESLVRSLSKD
ncbi:MAG TPA: UDP-N-acetylmuramoyl-L-alanine--D-glutamate ligase [Pirellulales bacterium]|jgi:UDP-N-acetylmuramoylalanine--D-glutamate ligase